jgi:hypothetical protein
MSLWLRISAIVLKVILKVLINYFEKILLKLILMSGLNECFNGLIDIMKKFIFYLMKLKNLSEKDSQFINFDLFRLSIN